jgi:ankyrin repeat protein
MVRPHACAMALAFMLFGGYRAAAQEPPAVPTPGPAPAQATPTIDGRLSIALQKDDIEGVRSALEQGADPNHQDPRFKVTPFLRAVMGRQTAIARLLLEKGADPNVELSTKELRVPAITFAVNCADGDLITMMIDRGAKASVIDSLGNTPMTTAVTKDAITVLTALLEKGVDPYQPDNNGRTPLTLAAQFGRVGAVNLLLAHGVDPNRPDGNGRTPMKAAKTMRQKNVVELLRKAGAK